MAIKVRFYTFTKQENSTKIPSSGGTEFDCTLKDASSIFFPVIKLNRGAATTAAPTFNYCYIPDFGRYYFITDWSWDLGLWDVSLKCDVLGSYRTQIGNENLYALRAAADYDGAIPDHLYPAKAGCTFTSEAVSGNRPWGNPLAGVYVLGIVSKDADFGSIDYVVLSRTNIKTFIQSILTTGVSAANGYDVTDASYSLQASLIDPLQYIKSCTYIPFTATELTSCLTPQSNISIWDWDFPIANDKVKYSAPYFSYSGTITIPKHPQAATRGQFANQAPFTELTFYAPPFGAFTLDTTSLVGISTLSFNVQVDLPSGLGILTISNGNIIMQRIEAQIGVPVQLSQVIHDYAGAIMNGINTVGNVVGSAMSGNVAGAIFGGISGAIGSAVMAKYPAAQSIGSGGSYAQLTGVWQIAAQFFTIADDDIQKNGRPLCRVIKPANLGGYMLIQDGDVPIAGTHEEAQEIKRYLEGGFYYE